MEYDIEKIVSNMDFKSLELVNLNNGLSLTNNEIMILDRYGIDYKQCSSLKEVLSLIEEVFTYEMEALGYTFDVKEDKVHE